jgi:hypothetical protein
MKVNQRMLPVPLVWGSALLAEGNVHAATDIEVCKAGYKIMLMTPGECRGYLKEFRAARSSADHMAVLGLQEWHTALLIERSQACPCQFKPTMMRSLHKNGLNTHFACSGKY